MFELYIYPLKLSKRPLEKVPTIHVFACHAAQFLRVDLSSVGPDLVPAGVGVHRDVKTRGELLASPPSHEGSLHLLLDIPADVAADGAALLPPILPQTGVTQSESCCKFPENLVTEVVVLVVVRTVWTVSGRPGGVEDEERSCKQSSGILRVGEEHPTSEGFLDIHVSLLAESDHQVLGVFNLLVQLRCPGEPQEEHGAPDQQHLSSLDPVLPDQEIA